MSTAAANGVFAMRPGQVIGHLVGVRVERTYDVAANRLKVCALREVEGREAGLGLVKGRNCGVVLHQSELRERLLTLDGKVGQKDRGGEAVTEFVQQVAGEFVVMRNQEAAVMLVVHVVRQQRIEDVDQHVLPVVADEHLLFGRDDLVDAAVETIGARRSGHQRLIVQSARQIVVVRQRIVVIAAASGQQIDLRTRNREVG